VKAKIDWSSRRLIPISGVAVAVVIGVPVYRSALSEAARSAVLVSLALFVVALIVAGAVDTLDRAKGALEFVKSLITVIGFAGTCVALYYYFAGGNLLTNMSVSVMAKREPRDAASDHLAILVTLKKGDRNSVDIRDIEARIEQPAQSGAPGATKTAYCTSFGAVERKATDFDSSCEPAVQGAHVCWDRPAKWRWTNLSRGEEATFACYSTIAAGLPATVDVVVLGSSMIDGGKRLTQWRSSTVAFPKFHGTD